MPALEPLGGIRVVASPAALETARFSWDGDRMAVLRLAPDEAFAIGARDVELDDPDAIVESEAGFVAASLSAADLALVREHTEWPVTAAAGSLGQGKVAGVPARLVGGDRPLLVTHAAYAHELLARLGWLP